jgi:hypothetical protein
MLRVLMVFLYPEVAATVGVVDEAWDLARHYCLRSNNVDRCSSKV